MNFEFCKKCDTGRSVVIFVKDTELFRARYEKRTQKSYKIVSQPWPKLLCHSKTANEFMQFTRSISFFIYSYKGANAIKLSSECHGIAASFVSFHKNKNIGLIVIGVLDHVFLVRFSINNRLLFLEDIYELDNQVGRLIMKKQLIPASCMWQMCEFCCKKSTMRCRHCSTMYCSKLCQSMDWRRHKASCAQKNSLTASSDATFCVECSS